MAPPLPFLMRSMRYSSLRSEFDSFGPLPWWRPPSGWQKPQVVANICWPLMSSGEAPAPGGFADGLAGGLAADVDCAGAEADSHGQMMAVAAMITNCIRIPSSMQTGTGGRERSLPPSPWSLSSQREHDQRAGIFRHALEGLAVERNIFVGDQAAPTRRYGYILLAACHVADDAGIVAGAVVARPQLLAAFRIVGVHDAFGIRHEHQVAGGGEHAGERRLFIVDLPLHGAGHGIAGAKMT